MGVRRKVFFLSSLGVCKLSWGRSTDGDLGQACRDGGGEEVPPGEAAVDVLPSCWWDSTAGFAGHSLELMRFCHLCKGLQILKGEKQGDLCDGSPKLAGMLFF